VLNIGKRIKTWPNDFLLCHRMQIQWFINIGRNYFEENGEKNCRNKKNKSQFYAEPPLKRTQDSSDNMYVFIKPQRL